MPQTVLDGLAVIGVVATVLGAYFAWRQLRGSKQDEPTTINEIKNGSRNTQSGAAQGKTVNRIENGNDNQQSG